MLPPGSLEEEGKVENGVPSSFGVTRIQNRDSQPARRSRDLSDQHQHLFIALTWPVGLAVIAFLGCTFMHIQDLARHFDLLRHAVSIFLMQQFYFNFRKCKFNEMP